MPPNRQPGSAQYILCENQLCPIYQACNKVPTTYKDCEPINRSFSCPKCGSSLYWAGAFWRCSSIGKEYPLAPGLKCRSFCDYITN